MLLFFLISGYVPYFGYLTGFHVYARKKEPSDYWFACLLYVVITIFLSYKLLSI